MADTLTQALGAFVAGQSHATLPESLRHGGRRARHNPFATARPVAADPARGSAVAPKTA